MVYDVGHVSVFYYLYIFFFFFLAGYLFRSLLIFYGIFQEVFV